MGRGGEGAQVEGPQARRGREGTLGEEGQGAPARHRRRQPRGVLGALARIEALAPRTVVPGHYLGDSSRSLEAVRFTANYIRDFDSEAAKAKDAGALIKAISLGERAMTLKNIAQTLKTLSEAGEAVQGKKAQRQANAEKSASGGKFAAPSAPRIMN